MTFGALRLGAAMRIVHRFTPIPHVQIDRWSLRFSIPMTALAAVIGISDSPDRRTADD
jgi:hypothetical protein